MTVESLAPARHATLEALRPPPKISLSEWTERHVRLPASLSAQPGLMRLWPHQKAIADSIGDPAVERVSVLKSARVGYTQLIIGAIGAYTANDPSPILVVLPAENDCRTLMVNTIEPVFAETPVLADLLSDDRGRDVLLERHFPGGSLKLVSARAPRNLRGHTARVLFLDEVDAFEVDVRGEGDPVSLAERRTQTFANRKIVMGSTPVHEDTSKICRAYERSDQRVFEVPCPLCDTAFEIQWAHIKWDEGQPETAYCACPHCGGVIEEADKPAMVDAGRWRATKPEVKGHHGYRLNALISLLPNARWGVLAAEFLEAKKSPETLQAFVNTVLGQPWRDDSGEGFDEDDLRAKAEPIGLQSVPEGVYALTCGVDVQRDRLETVTLGHTDDQTLILDQRVFWGGPESLDVWAELRDFISGVWQTPDKRIMRMGATAIDAGDGETMDRVLDFARANRAMRVFAVKGAAGERTTIAPAKSARGPLFIVGVDGVKRQIHSRLSSGTVRFSNSLEGRFYEELCSERLVTRYSRGVPVRRWERISGRRAESLDCVVYGFAVRSLLQKPAAPDQSARTRPSVAKSKFLSR